ncbi:DUF561 domain-containing protein [Pediococcus ethanolidurans]|uniref:NAD(P)H-dependent flavin oxidoreductase n=1 Tax=Pediococcus ethanolidurans TaxID=319653 RepID=UPI002953251F|nr:DUF561 domain-containing protein [Pediococcus ethanolidurans]MDV7719498.1 DUF561 domain-containing protein [Pediococcus ethanolidurans]
MIKRITTILNTKYPLIQAPMSWMTDATLVAAVSEADGLGVLGPNAGQNEPAKSAVDAAEKMRYEISKVRQLTNYPFGINILPPAVGESLTEHDFTRELLTVAFAEQIKVYVVVGALNVEVFNLIKAHGGTIVYRPLTPTIDVMQRAEQLGADILVATGSDEGGVLPIQEYGTFTVVSAMVDAVKLPVMAAGGINDARGVKAAFALGAAGVYVGSRFLMTQESRMNTAAKQRVLQATHADIVRVSTDQRSLVTAASQRFNEQWLNHEHIADLDQQISDAGGLRPAMLAGQLDVGIIQVNVGVETLNDVPTVAQLVQRLMTTAQD